MTIWKGTTLIFWAFIGWEALSFGVGEFKDPRRAVPIVYGVSYVLVIAIYLVLALTATGAARSGQPVTGPSGLFYLLEGTALAWPALFVIVLLIVANANAWTYASSRFLYSAGKDGLFPSWLGIVSQDHVPRRAIAAFMFLTLPVLLASFVAHIAVADLILLVNQNYVFLYLAALWVYARVESRPWVRWTIVPISLATCGLFLSGFSAWVLYPFFLISLGLWQGRGRR